MTMMIEFFRSLSKNISLQDGLIYFALHCV